VVSWDLDISQWLPKERHRYPHAPFASLITDPPGIADEAWTYYRIYRGNAQSDQLLRVIGDAPFSVPTLEATVPYRLDVGDRPTGDERAVNRWERRRRSWLCEFLIRYQFAYEMTAYTLQRDRQGGIVSRVEVVGDPEKCSVCRFRFVGVHPITAVIEIPHPLCDHPFGCMAAVIPLLDKPLGEV
jgi:hypothetical protein